MAAAKKRAPKRVPSSRSRDAVRATFERKREELKKLRTDGTKSWDRQWELVDAILTADPPLWSGHYRSEAAFIAGELPGETLRSVRRNVLVASAFSPSDEKAHGVNKLEEVALYLMARSGTTARPRAVDLARVVVRVPDGGRGFRQVRATDATIEEIRAARRVARGSDLTMSPARVARRRARGRPGTSAIVRR